MTSDISIVTSGLAKLASTNSSDSDSPPTPRLALEVGNDIAALKRDLGEGHDLESDDNSSESGFGEQENKDHASPTSSACSSRTITPTGSMRRENGEVVCKAIAQPADVRETVTIPL